MNFKFRLVGVSPLLPHADDVDRADQLEEWRKAPENKNKSRAGDDRTPAWTWLTYTYTDGHVLTIPSDNLMVALRGAGANLILKKQKTFKALTQSGLVIKQEHMPLLVNGEVIRSEVVNNIANASDVFSDHAKGVQALGFRLFVKRAKIGQSKHIRVRARFDEWAINGEIETRTDDIAEEHVHKLFEIAGRDYGLCDWRPSAPKAPGPFGRFTCEIVKAA